MAKRTLDNHKKMYGLPEKKATVAVKRGSGKATRLSRKQKLTVL